jgi:hypothetical protein
MLHEIAITPSVFYPETYGSQGLCDAHMQGIRDPLLECLIVRDLRASAWKEEVQSRFGEMTDRAKTLIKSCITRGRFRIAPSALHESPKDSIGWCNEAFASNRQQALAGILASPEVKAKWQRDESVASIENVSDATWWQQCVVNVHPDGPLVARNTAAYLTRLAGVLRHANHILFADPHIDPTRYGYREFVELLRATARPKGPKPAVEIHRVRYEGSGGNKSLVDRHEWERRFRETLRGPLSAVGVAVDVFIWEDGHDRHVISNLLGLHVGNGFDTTKDPNAYSTWTRLGSLDRDAFQRHYDPQTRPRDLFHRFKI